MIEEFDTDEENDNLENNVKKKKAKKPESKLFCKITIIITLIIILIIVILFLRKYYFNDNKLYNVLIGDIGGTNIRLRLVEMTKDINIQPIIVKSEYKSTLMLPFLLPKTFPLTL